MANPPYSSSSDLSLASRLGGILITFLIGLLPVTMMTELRGGSANFWALVLVSLIVCSLRTGGMRAAFVSLLPYKVLVIALLMMPLTVFMSMLWSHELLGGDFERSVRVFIGTLAILAACLSLSPGWLKQSMWGGMAGVAGGAGALVWTTWPHFSRPDMDQYTTVGYSNALLLLTVLVLFSLGWQLSRFKRTEQLLKIAIVFIGLVGVVIAETRSSWIAVPFFIAIGLLLLRSSLSLEKLIVLGVVIITLATATFFTNPVLATRAQQGAREFMECHSTTPIADTSVCTRLQLWRASWLMFKANPLLANAGSAKFEDKLEQLHQQGIVSATTSKEFGEPHNDLFFALANYGIMGLIAFLLMYSVPAVLFAKRMSPQLPQEIRVAAAMGLAVCIGFVAFGLTEAMFRSMRMLSFYAVLIAWLLALSHITHQQTNPK